ncbi:hypothetical protein Chor_008061 [Crotalus horridus]
MIEVLASLQRGAAFLAGEALECVVTLRNPLPPDATSASSSDLPGDLALAFACLPLPDNPVLFLSSSEILAWASAQIHCQLHTSETRVALPPSQDTSFDAQAENETVFVPNRAGLAQRPLPLPPDSYCETLPVDGPPSFRGQAVKYVYKLTIGCQRVNSAIKLLRVPFRVMVLQGLRDYPFPQDEAVAPSNPFLEEEEGSVKKTSRLVDLATELLTVATSRRSLPMLLHLGPVLGHRAAPALGQRCPSPDLFNISSARGRVATFCIFKTIYKIGEDVVGTFSFSEGDTPCLQYLVSLQTEERVQDTFQRRRGQAASYSTHARHQESCLHTARTSFSLPIPLSSAPGFSTNVVSLQWRLHFEFVTLRDVAEAPVTPKDPSEAASWTGVEQMDVDTFSWDLPIKVLPTSPLLATSISQLPSCSALTI